MKRINVVRAMAKIVFFGGVGVISILACAKEFNYVYKPSE